MSQRPPGRLREQRDCPEPSVRGRRLGGAGVKLSPLLERESSKGEKTSTRAWMQLFPLTFPLFLQIKQTSGRYVHLEHRMNVRKQQTLLTNLGGSRILES